MEHVSLVFRAGYNRQSPANAGFLDLYAKLFLTTVQSRAFDGTPVETITSSSNVSFSANVDTNNLSSFLSLLSECALRPSFTEKDIKSAYEAQKKQIATYIKTDAAYINSAIESRIAHNAPWKESFGTNPETFASYTTTQVKELLYEIQTAFYTPQNAALFVAGAKTGREIATLAAEQFAEWQPGAVSDERTSTTLIPSPANRKFVLVSDGFSKDLTQIALQWTGFSAEEAEALSTVWNEKLLENMLVKTPLLAIRSKSYINTKATNENNLPRLILQGVMEQPFSLSEQTADIKKIQKKTNIVLQAEKFVELAKIATTVDNETLRKAAARIHAETILKTSGGPELIKRLASFWSLNAGIQSKELFAQLKNAQNSILSVSAESIAQKKEEPFVFIMVHPDVYKANTKLFVNAGYELIEKSNDAWYKNSSYSITSPQPQQIATALTTNQEIYSSYFINNTRTLSSSKLSNGIPVVIKTNKGSQTVVTSIAIAGGEAESPKQQQFLRTVLINAFASCINKEIKNLREDGKIVGPVKILAWTTECISYITMECLKNELPTALEATVNAIIFGDVQPLLADNLIRELNYQRRVQRGPLTSQLKAAAMQYAYKGTNYETIYNTSTEILESMDFQTITLAYTSLLDASLYSLVIAGDITPPDAVQEAEKTLGLLKNMKKRVDIHVPTPSYEGATLTISLQHTYESDKTAESAPKDSPILVPTKKFYDPMQYYFIPPAYGTQRELFNALLFELEYLTEEDLGEGYSCRTQRATGIVQLGMLEAEHLLHKKSFSISYKAARNRLVSELQDSKLAPARIAHIKNLWNRTTMTLTQNNEGIAQLIQDGIIDGNANLYLDSYLVMANASNSDFLRILDMSIPENPMLKVFSKDSLE